MSELASMNAKSIVKLLASEKDMFVFADKVAKAIKNGAIIFLKGSLGAGKTTFVRGVLRAFGFHGKVKSPTYALLEPYEIDQHKIFHFDFYRINSPKELDFIGVEEYFLPAFICLVEWPEKGESHLPTPDLLFEFTVKNETRELTITAHTKHGTEMLTQL